MTTVEKLQAARALIAEEARWCQYSGARDSSGASVDCNVPEACAWCAEGALAKVCDISNWAAVYEASCSTNAYRFLSIAAMGILCIYGYPCGPFRDYPYVINDDFDHAKTLEMFDAAIALAMESKGNE